MISCHQYDYIEIACLYHLPLKLTMLNGEVIEGVAKDTLRDHEKRECILIAKECDQLVVALDDLATMQVAVENPYFDIVYFHNNPC